MNMVSKIQNLQNETVTHHIEIKTDVNNPLKCIIINRKENLLIPMQLILSYLAHSLLEGGTVLRGKQARVGVGQPRLGSLRGVGHTPLVELHILRELRSLQEEGHSLLEQVHSLLEQGHTLLERVHTLLVEGRLLQGIPLVRTPVRRGHVCHVCHACRVYLRSSVQHIQE